MLGQRIESWYQKSGIKILYFVLVVFIGYLIIRLHIISLTAPFIAAWLIAGCLNPVVTWLYKKVHLPRGLGTLFSMLILLSSIVWTLILLIKQLWYQITAFSGHFPQYSEQFMEGFFLLQDRFKAVSSLDYLLEQFLSSISSFLTTIIPTVYSIITKLPNLIVFIIVMLIATFFMTKDYNYIKAFVKAQLSDTVIYRFSVMQKGLIDVIGGYIKTQLILMWITFCICMIGLFLFEINYALLISSIIALVDALPVFGSGTILIPWIIYKLIIGDYVIALGLLGIYGILFVMRQVMEPKIFSHQIGLYALVTVMGMYIGYKAIGIFGLIAGPIIIVIITMFQDVGVLPKFKAVKDYEEEYE
ncbi:MAG: ytvI [Clostridia bacterium]|nr:ytvI [Clostridia bacterium]